MTAVWVGLGALVVLGIVAGLALLLRGRPDTGDAADEPDDAPPADEPQPEADEREREAAPDEPRPTAGEEADAAASDAAVEAQDAVEAPPAAIRLHAEGVDPWAPARTFSAALCAEDHETSVELPDLVVLRDAAREPLVIRDVPGRPAEVLVTTPPDRMASALEALVRALLREGYELDTTGGRVILLARADERLTLTVEQPAPV